eukprot:scaffold23980_cov59-Phaeocystis_antarctica.AAC.2
MARVRARVRVRAMAWVTSAPRAVCPMRGNSSPAQIAARAAGSTPVVGSKQRAAGSTPVYTREGGSTGLGQWAVGSGQWAASLHVRVHVHVQWAAGAPYLALSLRCGHSKYTYYTHYTYYTYLPCPPRSLQCSHNKCTH